MGWQEGGVGTTCDMRHAMPLSHAHASTKSRAPRRARQDACAFFSSLSCGGKRKLNFSTACQTDRQASTVWAPLIW